MYSKTIYTVDVQYKRPSCKVVYFCQTFTYVIYIATFNCPKGILGLVGGGGGGGKASNNKLKDASFIFSMTNVTILSIFCTHAQKEYRIFLETKGTYILNILTLLLF